MFVTHDIDEAIKMGDRIAILGEQSVIRQFDTPERILAYPVDDFVSDFIGSGSTLKGLNFERVRDLQLSEDWPIVSVDTDRADAQRLYDASPEKWMLVLDAISARSAGSTTITSPTPQRRCRKPVQR